MRYIQLVGSLDFLVLYILKLSLISAMSGTSYILLSLLAVGSARPRWLKSIPQEMLAENLLGRSLIVCMLLISSVMAMMGVL